MASNISKEEVIEFISNMTVIELSEMIKELEEKFGVTAAAPVALGMGPAPTAEAAAQEEEKTEFDVILTSFGDKKIQVIKAVRAITNLGLKEAKELVEKVPQPVKEGVTKEEAESVLKELEEAGGQAEIK